MSMQLFVTVEKLELVNAVKTPLYVRYSLPNDTLLSLHLY